MANPRTTFVRVEVDDLYAGFDPDTPPDSGPYWDPDTQEITEEWHQLMLRWERAQRYLRYHSHVPVAGAYEMPDAAKHWADEIIAGHKVSNLIVYGGVGTGKTHGACATACYLSALWDRAQFTDAPNIVFKTASMLLSELKAFGDTRDEVMHHSLHTKVLVIDDLTRFEIKNFDIESMGQILDTRMGKGLPTILTLNYPAIDLDQALQDLPPFLASRIQGGHLAFLFGPDRRREEVA